jgi:hypothetical protein
MALALAGAACTTTGDQTTGSIPSPNATVAFESIDGPPPPVFRRLVQKLDEEARARNVPVVSREGFAPYRVRGYLAAAIEKKQKRTLVTWVWDVYDAQQSRAFRISGEETVSGTPADAWTVVDDTLLARVAEKGMAQLSDYLRAGPPPSAAEPPQGDPVAGEPVAAADPAPANPGNPRMALVE